MSRRLGVILSFILMFLETASALFLTPFIIWALGDAEYGVYKLSAALVAYLMLLDMGIGNAVTRYIAKFRITDNLKKMREFLGIVSLFYMGIAIVSVVVGMILITVYPILFEKGLSVEEIALGQKLLMLTIFNTAITLGTTAYANTIVAYERFAISKGISIIQVLLRIVLTIAVLKMGMRSIGVVAVNLLLTIICRGTYVFFVLFKLKLWPDFGCFDGEFIKEVIRYSSLILLQMVATQINAFADQVLIGAFVPMATTIISIYSIGEQITQYFQSIGTSMTGILMPGVVKLVENSATPQELAGEMVRIGRLIFMLLAFIWVCFLVYGQQFIELWVGAEKTVAYYIAVLLMLAYTFILTEAIGTQILWAMNAHKQQAILKMGVVAINVMVTVVLIRWNPLVGAAVGTFISLLCGDIVVLNVIFSRKIGISLSEYYIGLFAGIAPCLGIVAFIGYAMRFVFWPGWIGLIIKIIVMVIVYGELMLHYGMNKYERELIKSLLKKVKLYREIK